MSTDTPDTPSDDVPSRAARLSIAPFVFTTGIGHDAPFTSSVSAISYSTLIGYMLR